MKSQLKKVDGTSISIIVGLCILMCFPLQFQADWLRRFPTSRTMLWHILSVNTYVNLKIGFEVKYFATEVTWQFKSFSNIMQDNLFLFSYIDLWKFSNMFLEFRAGFECFMVFWIFCTSFVCDIWGHTSYSRFAYDFSTRHWDDYWQYG